MSIALTIDSYSHSQIAFTLIRTTNEDITINWRITDPNGAIRFEGVFDFGTQFTQQIIVSSDDHYIINGDALEIYNSSGALIDQFVNIEGAHPARPFTLSDYSENSDMGFDRRVATNAQFIRGDALVNNIFASEFGDLIYGAAAGDTIMLGAGVDTIVFRVDSRFVNASGGQFIDSLRAVDIVSGFEVGRDRLIFVDIAQIEPIAIDAQANFFNSLNVSFSSDGRLTVGSENPPGTPIGTAKIEITPTNEASFPISGGWEGLEAYFGIGNIRFVSALDIASGVIDNSRVRIRDTADTSVNLVEDTMFTIDLNDFFIDLDGDAITYSTGDLPAGVNFNSTAMQLEGIVQSVGTSQIEIFAVQEGYSPLSRTLTVTFDALTEGDDGYFPYAADDFTRSDITQGANFRDALQPQHVVGSGDAQAIFASEHGDLIVPGGGSDSIYLGSGSDTIIIRFDSSRTGAEQFTDFNSSIIGPFYDTQANLPAAPGTPEFENFYFTPNFDRLILVDTAATEAIALHEQASIFDNSTFLTYYTPTQKLFLFSNGHNRNFSLRHSGESLIPIHESTQLSWAQLSDALSATSIRLVAPSQLGFDILPNTAPTGDVEIILAHDTLIIGDIVRAENTLSDADRVNTITYHWYHASDTEYTQAIATGDSYTIRDDDMGQRLVVTASYIDGHNNNERVFSAPTNMSVETILDDIDTYTLFAGETYDARLASTAQIIAGTNNVDTILSSAHGDIIFGGQGADSITLGAGQDTIIIRVDSSNDTQIFYDAQLGVDNMGERIFDFNFGTDRLVFVDIAASTPIRANAQAAIFNQLPLLSGTADDAVLGSGAALLVGFVPDITGSLGFFNSDASTVSVFPLTPSWSDLELHFGTGNIRLISQAQLGYDFLTNAPAQGNVAIITPDSTLTIGDTLTVESTISDADGVGSIAHYWYHADDFADNGELANILSIGDSYRVQAGDVGEMLIALARYTDLYNNREAIVSSPTSMEVVYGFGDMSAYTPHISFNYDARDAVSPQIIGGSDGDDSIFASAHGDIIFMGQGADVVRLGAGDDTLIIRVDSRNVNGAGVFYDAQIDVGGDAPQILDFDVQIDRLIFVDISASAPIRQAEQSTLFDELYLRGLEANSPAFGSGAALASVAPDGQFPLDIDGIINFYNSDASTVSPFPSQAGWSNLSQYFGSENIRFVAPMQLAPGVIPNIAASGGVEIHYQGALLTSIPYIGDALDVDISTLRDPDGIGAIEYRWFYADDTTRVSPIATGARYVVRDADMGRRLVVEAHFSDDNAHDEVVESSPSPEVISPFVAPMLTIDTTDATLSAANPAIEFTTNFISFDANLDADLRLSINGAIQYNLGGVASSSFTTLHSDGSQITIAITPENAASLAQSVLAVDRYTLTLIDNTDLSSEAIEIAVNIIGTNDAPFVSTPPTPLTILEDALFELDLTTIFTDPDVFTTLTFSSDNLPSWASISGNMLNGAPGDYDLGTVNINLTASDEYGASISTSLELTVENTPDAPRPSGVILPNIRVGVGEVASITLDELSVYFTDPDPGDVLSFVFPTAHYPDWVSYNEATRTLTASPPLDATSGSTIPIYATDSSGATGEVRAWLRLDNVNPAPVLDTALSQTIGYISADINQYGRVPSGQIVFNDDATPRSELTYRVNDQYFDSQNAAAISGEYGVLRATRSQENDNIEWQYLLHADADLSSEILFESFIFRANDGLRDSIGVAVEVLVNLMPSTQVSYTYVPEGGPETASFAAPPASASRFIYGTQGNDTILSNTGNDIIIGGTGIDKITLQHNDSQIVDIISYTFDAQHDDGWAAYDGSDTIIGFQRGIDKLLFVARTHANDFEFETHANDNISLRPSYDLNGDVSGISIVFAASHYIYGGIPTGNRINLSFADAVAHADFETLLGAGYDATHNRIENIIDLESGVNYLEAILGGTASLEISPRIISDNHAPTGILALDFIYNDADVGAISTVDVSHGNVISQSSRQFRVGDVLRADVSGLADIDGIGAFEYQWIKLDVSERQIVFVEDASAVQYRLRETDIGDFLRLSVSYNDGSNNEESVISGSIRVWESPVQNPNPDRQINNIDDTAAYEFDVDAQDALATLVDII